MIGPPKLTLHLSKTIRKPSVRHPALSSLIIFSNGFKHQNNTIVSATLVHAVANYETGSEKVLSSNFAFTVLAFRMCTRITWLYARHVWYMTKIPTLNQLVHFNDVGIRDMRFFFKSINIVCADFRLTLVGYKYKSKKKISIVIKDGRPNVYRLLSVSIYHGGGGHLIFFSNWFRWIAIITCCVWPPKIKVKYFHKHW